MTRVCVCSCCHQNGCCNSIPTYQYIMKKQTGLGVSWVGHMSFRNCSDYLKQEQKLMVALIFLNVPLVESQVNFPFGYVWAFRLNVIMCLFTTSHMHDPRFNTRLSQIWRCTHSTVTNVLDTLHCCCDYYSPPSLHVGLVVE